MWSRGPKTSRWSRAKSRAARSNVSRLRSARTAVLLVSALLLAACKPTPSETTFPEAGRDVAPIVSDSFSTEDARDRVGEAEQVIAFAQVQPGMFVADVGAGEGYFTVRLSPVVGRKGRVLAEDIDPGVRDALSNRIDRETLDNVAVKLGTPDNPMLPRASFDRIFLVHMYHEVRRPYAFLWHLVDGLKPGGEVVLVDADRPVKNHGIPPAQADCEMRAVGLAPARSTRIEGSDAFVTAYRVVEKRPEPGAIKACAAKAANSSA